MRILLVSSNFPLSREEMAHSFVFDHAKELEELGHEVRVVREGGGSGDLIADRGSSSFGRAIRALECIRYMPKSPRYPVKVWRTIRYAAKISQAIDDWEPHVVHAFFAYPEGAATALALGRGNTIPLVTSVLGHDIDVEPNLGYGLRLNPYVSQMITYALERSARIVAGSQSLSQETSKILGNGGKVVTIPPGVDCKKFRPRAVSRAIRKRFGLSRSKAVLTIRRLSPEYGIKQLITAFSSVASRLNAKLILGGDGPLLEETLALSKGLGLSKVLLLGAVPRSRVPQLMASCDVYCDPCLLGQGVSTLEAMASGKPVVGFDTFTTKVIHGRTGLLVRPGDTHALAEALEALLRDASRTRRMGEAGRRLVERHYDLDRNVRKALRVYSQARRG